MFNIIFSFFSEFPGTIEKKGYDKVLIKAAAKR
jgi:hypothetical protein